MVKTPLSKEEFLHLTHNELKIRTGVDIKNWSLWFNSKQSPTLESFERMAEKLDMPVLDLIAAFIERRSRTVAAKVTSTESIAS